MTSRMYLYSIQNTMHPALGTITCLVVLVHLHEYGGLMKLADQFPLIVVPCTALGSISQSKGHRLNRRKRGRKSALMQL